MIIINKTFRTLLVKFIMTLVIAWFTFTLIDRNVAGHVIITALVVTAFNYIIGDLYVLPKFGNIVASIGDGLLGAVTVYMVSMIIPALMVSTTSLILFAIIIAAAEFFFHQYFLRATKITPDNR